MAAYIAGWKLIAQNLAAGIFVVVNATSFTNSVLSADEKSQEQNTETQQDSSRTEITTSTETINDTVYYKLTSNDLGSIPLSTSVTLGEIIAARDSLVNDTFYFSAAKSEKYGLIPSR